MARPDHQLWTDLTAHLRRTHPSLCRHWFDDIEPNDLRGGTIKLVNAHGNEKTIRIFSGTGNVVID